MSAKVLMIQGTMSSAGKSLLVTALCRIYARRGLCVAPFKAQNMSNNAAVCPDGAEIGRAQYTQALACGITPTATMNPILLKPEADARSQVVVMGRPQATLPARTYYRHKQALWETVTDALDSLRQEHDLVIIEGAGSAAELNLKRGDLVNMAVARYVQAPVLLVGDIDRGGIFAQLLGTLWLLEAEERALVKGLLVNKFRGDSFLFEDGVRILEEKGGVPVLGVLPYTRHDIPEEDAVVLERPEIAYADEGEIEIVVIRLPRISNFDDFDPLAGESGVRVRYVDEVAALGRPDAIILPGTKSTISDLQWLRHQGLAEAIQRLATSGVAVAGICGGYQMLGSTIHDPDHVEASVDSVPGLALLPVETLFQGEKATHQVEALIKGGVGWLGSLSGQTVSGYEIHMGQTGNGKTGLWLEIQRRGNRPVAVPDGEISADGRVWGCYLHGLFANPHFRRAWLASLGWRGGAETAPADPLALAMDRLADTFEEAFAMKELDRIIGIP